MKTPKTNRVDDLSKVIPDMFYGMSADHLLDHWYNVLDHNIKHKGKAFAVKYMKQLYTNAVQYALYQTVTNIPFRKADKNGLIKDNKPFKLMLRGNLKQLRCALFVLRRYETLMLKPDHDISTIIEPCIANSNTLRSIDRFAKLRKVRNRLGRIRLDAPVDFLTTKKGPLRRGALLSWQDDLYNLTPDLLHSIKVISNHLGDTNIAERLEYYLADGYVHEAGPTTRLQAFSANGGKTRLVAIYDYWSQRTLRPLHKSIFRNLRNLKADCTFDHNSGVEWMKSLPNGTALYSFDLTAATDRLPLQVHRSVLESLLYKRDKFLIPHILKLMMRKFTVSWDTNRQVSYNCGQPMGAYGSWALLALSHHLIAMYCGCKSTDYRIVGDDIVIRGTKAGKDYRIFMNKLGVSISEAKSMVSPPGSPHIVGEFAKRILLDGSEITSPTPNLVTKANSDFRLFPLLVIDMERRGNLIPTASLYSLMNKTYSKSWTQRLCIILTFPLDETRPLEEFPQKVQDSVKWRSVSKNGLAILFVRFRIAKLLRSINTLLKVSEQRGESNTRLIKGSLESPYKYDSPFGVVKQNMLQSMIAVLLSLSNSITLIARGRTPLDVLPEITKQELFAPDLSLQFLDEDYQMQSSKASLLLELHHKLINNSVTKYITSTPLNPEFRALMMSNVFIKPFGMAEMKWFI